MTASGSYEPGPAAPNSDRVAGYDVLRNPQPNMCYRSPQVAVKAAVAAYNAGAITYAEMDDRIRWARRNDR